MGPHEPYWHTNTSFSPTPSRWDFRFQSEGLPFSLHDGVQLYGSSTLSNGKGGRGWMRGNHLHDLHYSASDGTEPFLSSTFDLSQVPQQNPPAIDDFETATRKDPSLGRIFSTPTKEGTSKNADSGGSNSSWSGSQSSESEFTAKSHSSSHRNFSSRRSLISEPVHPLSFPDLTLTREAFDSAVPGFSPLRESQRWSNASSSVDFTDVSKSFESETLACPHIHSHGVRCNLCERFISQRSPWSSRRIVRSADMPITGVLPCRHVFHVECLDQTTPTTHKNDPPCPLCIPLEESFSSSSLF